MPKGYGPVRANRRDPTWFEPSKSAQRIAKKALERIAKLARSKRGSLTKAEASKLGITSGIERAKSIARGDYQPAEDIRDFFNRFKGIYQDAILKGKSWEESKVQQSWDTWGGTPLWNDAKKALEKRGRKTGGKMPPGFMRLNPCLPCALVGLNPTDDPPHPNPLGDLAAKGEWVELDPSDFAAYPELGQELFDLVQTAYAPIGGNLKIRSPSDVTDGLTYWLALDHDADPQADVFVGGKQTPYGVKHTATGHDGSRESRRAVIRKWLTLLHRPGNFAEVSKRVAEIALDAGVPVVDDPATVVQVLRKDIVWHGEHPQGKFPGTYGWYSREIGGSMEPKILIGAPALATREDRIANDVLSDYFAEQPVANPGCKKKPYPRFLWDRAQSWADMTYAKHSAYKSMAKAKKFKELGGVYLDNCPRGTTEWLREKWVDICTPDLKPCGRQGRKDRAGKYPKCLPKAKAKALTKKQREDACKRKRKAEARAGGRQTYVSTAPGKKRVGSLVAAALK